MSVADKQKGLANITRSVFLKMIIVFEACLENVKIIFFFFNVYFIHITCSMNRLNTLPRGFGAFPALEVLDLTYNNLNESSLRGNFFCLSEFLLCHI